MREELEKLFPDVYWMTQEWLVDMIIKHRVEIAAIIERNRNL